MPQRKIIKASDLSGMYIYQDPKRGTIFYDIITRKGYILTSSDVKTYTIFTAMLPLCLVLALGMLSLFPNNYVIPVICFLVMFITYQVLFRILFFYKLPVAEKWHPLKRENIFISMARNFSKPRLLLLIGMLTVLSILMPIYTKMQNLSGINLYASYIVEALTVIVDFISIIALSVKIRNNY
ncbi:MAG: hypothetical protein K6A70_06755 [Erysipelotrichaceae bacterium]|nr:hypothetical protein [Erysipelotrichaceae bacterium]